MLIEDVYKDNYNIVYGYVFLMCNNSDIAEEITAEAFAKAIQHYKQFNGKSKISTWICQIAKNEFYKYQKKNKKTVPLEGSIECAYTDISLEDKITDKSVCKSIYKLLHKLDEPYKEVFTLRVLAELSFADIGEVFGKTENWARVTYHRARIKIIEQMED